MIFNNYRVMEHLRSLRQEELTPERVLELHRMLSEDTLDDPLDAGRYRLNDDVQVVDVRDNMALHVPPTYSDEIDPRRRVDSILAIHREYGSRERVVGSYPYRVF